MNIELLDAMRRYSVEALVDVLVRKDEYETTAINYAKDELARRNLSQTEIDALFQTRQKIYEEIINKATASLSPGWKIIYVLFPIIIPVYATVPFLIRYLLPHPPGFIYLRENGFDRKASQSCWYTFLGVIFWLMIISLWFTLTIHKVHGK